MVQDKVSDALKDVKRTAGGVEHAINGAKEAVERSRKVYGTRLLVRVVGQMDELERRIELEALAFAFPIAVVVLMTLGLLDLARPLNPDDWSPRHVWAMMPALYFMGLWRAKRRYQ
jgi:hypothetical protein